jgi:hypothetical protein
VREHPDDVVEAFEVFSASDVRRAERGVDVDRRKRETVGDVGGIEEKRGDGEDRGDDGRERNPQSQSSAGAVSPTDAALRSSRSNGPAYG